ncbi:MAG: alpha/beta hydrolase [Methylotetracoccus sp.]|nr:alpha/beta hydrolase [Methylotetracoccus sp.]
MSTDSGQYQAAWIEVNGIRLHVIQAGPEDGPLVILLHGFPEFWYGWRHQIPSLAAAGCRVWIPDQRGYNLSAKPAGIDAYRLERLAGDVVGLIEAAGEQQADVIGHDWGGAVAWWLAAHHPDRLRRLIVINCPHGSAFRRQIRRDAVQLWRSSYILFFQLPWLPEIVSRLGNGALPARVLRRSSNPGTFSDAELAHYRRAWSQQGAWTAMLNWYRAIVQCPPRFSAADRSAVPTLLIWGARDCFLSTPMAQPSIDCCDEARLVLFERATHWVHHECAPQVNGLLRDFLCAAG